MKEVKYIMMMDKDKDQFLQYFSQDDFDAVIDVAVKSQVAQSIMSVAEHMEEEVSSEPNLNGMLNKQIIGVVDFYKNVDFDKAMKDAFDYKSFLDFAIADKHENFICFGYYLGEEKYDVLKQGFVNSVHCFAYEVAKSNGLFPSD